MKSPYLNQIGSDPELLFGEILEWTPFIVSADQIITKNRQKALSAFIGTDGHMATAELRPPPAHNIRRHLYDIAVALITIDDYLKSSKTRSSYKMLAQPVARNEALGGHIHVSMFISDPIFCDLLKKNYIYSADNFVPYNRDIPTNAITASDVEIMRTFEQQVSRWEVPSPFVFVRVMNYLLRPFECWVQPWVGRTTRNRMRAQDGTYFGTEMDIRWMISERPNRPKFEDWAYVHYEYRGPSTWLINPWLAYAYLALVKLVVLNYNKCANLAVGNITLPHQSDARPANEKMREIFMERLARVMVAPYTITNDLTDLGHALHVIETSRSTWWNPANGIFVNDWRNLLKQEEYTR